MYFNTKQYWRTPKKLYYHPKSKKKQLNLTQNSLQTSFNLKEFFYKAFENKPIEEQKIIDKEINKLNGYNDEINQELGKF